MLQMFLNILSSIVELLKYPFYFVVGIFVVFSLLCVFFVIIELFKGKRFVKCPEGGRGKYKKHNFLVRIFVDLPHQFVNDLFNKDPLFFKYQGLIIFEGRQGAGKTISMIEFCRRMQKEFPLANCTTNLGYLAENKPLKNWKMLLNYKNDIKGVIVCMDELQNWFSSNDSKNFPPDMLTIITQNRKHRRIILGTSQNFYLLSKAIRSQATEVRRCTTLLGCLTIVRRAEPILDSEGNVVEFKNKGMYFFVHDKDLRDSYDTFKVIERLNAVGFKDTVDIENSIDINNNIINNIDLKKLKK